MWVAEVWGSLASLKYNQTRWHSDCGAQNVKKNEFENLNSSVSFRKSWPASKRWSTDLAVSAFTEEPFSFLYRCTEGSVHLLMNEKSAEVTAKPKGRHQWLHFMLKQACCSWWDARFRLRGWYAEVLLTEKTFCREPLLYLLPSFSVLLFKKGSISRFEFALAWNLRKIDAPFICFLIQFGNGC